MMMKFINIAQATHSYPSKSLVLHLHIFSFAWLQHLRAFNNFNSIMAILAGFNMAAVHRLKWTRGSLPEKYEQVCVKQR